MNESIASLFVYSVDDVISRMSTEDIADMSYLNITSLKDFTLTKCFKKCKFYSFYSKKIFFEKKLPTDYFIAWLAIMKPIQADLALYYNDSL